MSQELGKIDKPEVAEFKMGRKLLLVSLLYSGADAPVEYVEKFDLYWKQVAEQIEKLEAKLAKLRMEEKLKINNLLEGES